MMMIFFHFMASNKLSPVVAGPLPCFVGSKKRGPLPLLWGKKTNPALLFVHGTRGRRPPQHHHQSIKDGRHRASCPFFGYYEDGAARSDARVNDE
jgi:hypothetical protein